MKKQRDTGTPKSPKKAQNDFGVTGSNPEIVERMRSAVKMGGGNAVISEKSGIPLRTLANYLAGRSEMRASAIGAFCKATNISPQWLIYGDGPAEAAHYREWGPEEAHPIGQIAKLIYEAIYEAENLVEPETFDELMVELYNLHLQDIPDDDPRWQQFKRLMQISLRRGKQEKT